MYKIKIDKIMSVKIRETVLKNNKIRLSLDIYHKGISKYENLNVFIYQKPKTPLEKEHNKRTKALAENIRSKRILEIQDQRYGLSTGFKSQSSFLEYFQKLTRERRRSEGNFGNWYSAYKHLFNFANGNDVKFADVDDSFLSKFREYLLFGKVTKGNTNLSNASASSYLNKIKAALNQAMDERVIVDNPGKRVKGIKVPEGRRNYLILDEIRKLLKTDCEIPVVKQAFLFSCLTGLRWSDINKLVWQEVVFSEVEGSIKSTLHN